MARPSSYDPNKDYNKLANDYLATCGREQTKLPKRSEFCREYVGADEDTVKDWLKGKHIPEDTNVEGLSVAIKRIKTAQAEQLKDDGLYGGKEVNQAMAIFLLKANHGLIEPARLELVGKDGQPLIPTQYSFKVDLAGGYIPPMGAVTFPSTTSSQGPPQVQNFSMASESTKNDNGINRDNQTSPV